MARYVVTAPFVIPAAGYSQPERRHKKGDVVELSASEVSAITGAGGTLRTVTATAKSATQTHDTLGEAFAVSNSTV